MHSVALQSSSVIPKAGAGIASRSQSLPSVRGDLDWALAWSKIEALDLSLVKLKLTHPKHGLGWTEEEAVEGERWYKKYMFLTLKYPSAFLVPNHLIDEFWHQHILDTRMYVKDCLDIYGEFHHHYPYAGLLGEDDFDRWMGNIDMTKMLFKVEFALEYDRCTGNKCSCFGGCKCGSRMYDFEAGQTLPSDVGYRQRVGLN